MFENVGKEIKEGLQGVVFLSTLLWVEGALILTYFLDQFVGLDGGMVFGFGVFCTMIFGIIGYLRAKKKVMYRYAYAELVETVQKIQKHLEKDGAKEKLTEAPANMWKCPECGEINNEHHRFCSRCGDKQPKL